MSVEHPQASRTPSAPDAEPLCSHPLAVRRPRTLEEQLLVALLEADELDASDGWLLCFLDALPRAHEAFRMGLEAGNPAYALPLYLCQTECEERGFEIRSWPLPALIEAVDGAPRSQLLRIIEADLCLRRGRCESFDALACRFLERGDQNTPIAHAIDNQRFVLLWQQAQERQDLELLERLTLLRTLRAIETQLPMLPPELLSKSALLMLWAIDLYSPGQLSAESIESFANQLEDDGERSVFLIHSLEALAEQDPKAAAQRAAHLAESGADQLAAWLRARSQQWLASHAQFKLAAESIGRRLEYCGDAKLVDALTLLQACYQARAWSVPIANPADQVGETGQAPNQQKGQAPNRQEGGGTGQAPNQQEVQESNDDDDGQATPQTHFDAATAVQDFVSLLATVEHADVLERLLFLADRAFFAAGGSSALRQCYEAIEAHDRLHGRRRLELAFLDEPLPMLVLQLLHQSASSQNAWLAPALYLTIGRVANAECLVALQALRVRGGETLAMVTPLLDFLFVVTGFGSSIGSFAARSPAYAELLSLLQSEASDDRAGALARLCQHPSANVAVWANALYAREELEQNRLESSLEKLTIAFELLDDQTGEISPENKANTAKPQGRQHEALLHQLASRLAAAAKRRPYDATKQEAASDAPEDPRIARKLAKVFALARLRQALARDPGANDAYQRARTLFAAAQPSAAADCLLTVEPAESELGSAFLSLAADYREAAGEREASIALLERALDLPCSQEQLGEHVQRLLRAKRFTTLADGLERRRNSSALCTLSDPFILNAIDNARLVAPLPLEDKEAVAKLARMALDERPPHDWRVKLRAWVVDALLSARRAEEAAQFLDAESRSCEGEEMLALQSQARALSVLAVDALAAADSTAPNDEPVREAASIESTNDELHRFLAEPSDVPLFLRLVESLEARSPQEEDAEQLAWALHQCYSAAIQAAREDKKLEYDQE
ncbi:MAG: hypothetical protein RBU37_13055, partial [Myxococcota bacterium]|nr:hypothetical protein [Myxococcota bacterium]